MPPDQPSLPLNHSVEKAKSLKAQIIEKDQRITDLDAIISGLNADTHQLQNQLSSLRLVHDALSEHNRTISIAHNALTSLKQKADTQFTDELGKRHKRIKRLERERDARDEANRLTVTNLHEDLGAEVKVISKLQHDLAIAMTRIHCGDTQILTLNSALRDKQSSLPAVRNRLYTSQKKAGHASESLKKMEKRYNDLAIWDAKEDGEFTGVARELSRNLTYAGVSAGKMEFAVLSCARAFGIKVRQNKFMSRHTVGRTIDEGGKYGELQLAREILEAPGFVESSDGTTHRGITVKTRSITLLVPSYALDADDHDKSTWSHQTRFVEVAPALDHTGQHQFEGTKEAATRIADTYTRSPLASKEKHIMDKNEYWRKKLGEGKDHAADGKKEFNISAGGTS
ncbi:hypothetical protein DFH07DRAFT_971112 [Mycena maculata]|uniref:Uncharacterized protein n=1 Tax=Mycena maculata TaxID=230809 RepID=A0AAD7MNC0_9AGAR|nr:hypothetical protein DFH07DRAFT_971112 [Mycena maculata]